MEKANIFFGSVRALQKIIIDNEFDVVGEFGEEGEQKIGERDVYVSYAIETKGNVAYIKKNIYSAAQIAQAKGRQTRQNSHNNA
jgi:hypothetical protein